MLIGAVGGFRLSAASTQGTFDWVQIGGGRGAETSGSVALDEAGNSFMTGSYSEVFQLGELLLASVGGADVFVLKADPSGKPLWLTTLAGGLDDYSTGVAPDSEGGCWVAWGDSLSRISNTGEILWTRQFIETLGTFGVVLTSVGDVITVVRDSEQQLTLHRVNPDGGDVWTKSVLADSESANLAIDSAGNLFLGLRCDGEVTVGDRTVRLPPGNGPTLVVAKFDSEGALLWVRFAEGAPVRRVNGFKTAFTNELIVCGLADGPFTLGGRQFGATNQVTQGFVGVLNRDGLVRWGAGDQRAEVTAAASLGTNDVVYSRSGSGVTEMRRVALETGLEWTVYGSVRVTDLATTAAGGVWVAGRYLGQSGLGTKPFDPPIFADDGVFLGRRALIKPLILLDPQSVTNVAGTYVRLEPQIDDADSRVSYQWYKNGAALAGATNATLDFPQVALSDVGAYTVALTNVDGGTLSEAAQVVVVHSLTVKTEGNGSVRTTPALPYYLPGTPVDVAAAPAEGFAFTGWTGDVVGTTDTLRVVMSANRQLVAHFVAIPRVVVTSGSDPARPVILLSGAAGQSAELEASEDLTSWHPVLSLRLTAEPAELHDLVPAGGKRFYRLNAK